MASIDDGKKAVLYARQVVEDFVKNKNIPNTNLEGIFLKDQGAFVTIHTFPDNNLRGCIGVPMPIMPLKDAIAEGAKSATHDPRFPPLDIQELDNIIIEVTILTRPQIIIVENPYEYLDLIDIGRDGLIAEQGFYKGLLLPQVPVEQGWNKEQFLNHTCMKAGLSPNAWKDNVTKISRFRGQVFLEAKPRGEIREKILDGSGN